MEHSFRGFRGGAGRGRGRGGGIGGPRGSHYSMSTESEDGKTFVIHPKRKFASLGISPKDITVEEVGFYSIHGDLDHHENVEVPADRSYMRSMAMHCTSSEPITVDFDLDEGYTVEALDKVIFTQQIPVLIKYVSQHSEDPRLLAIGESIDIVTTCSLLADLMQGLYNYQNWIFGAAKINGKVVVGNVVRPGIHGITRDGASNWHESSRGDHSKYWGRRFECYMTEENDREAADGPKVAAPRFRTVLHTKLKDMHLLLASGVDAQNSFSNDPYPQRYVDFVTVSGKSFDLGREKSLYGCAAPLDPHLGVGDSIRSLIYIGTGTIRAGINDEGHVTKVVTFRVKDIPTIIQNQERHIEHLWDPKVCLGYVYEILKYVKRVVYEFTCSKEEGRFSCKEITIEHAIGHEYAHGDADAFFA